ncbi:MAG: hypothetical protein WKG07_43025 [Hymenobacter sp.]
MHGDDTHQRQRRRWVARPQPGVQGRSQPRRRQLADNQRAGAVSRVAGVEVNQKAAARQRGEQ